MIWFEAMVIEYSQGSIEWNVDLTLYDKLELFTIETELIEGIIMVQSPLTIVHGSRVDDDCRYIGLILVVVTLVI